MRATSARAAGGREGEARAAVAGAGAEGAAGGGEFALVDRDKEAECVPREEQGDLLDVPGRDLHDEEARRFAAVFRSNERRLPAGEDLGEHVVGSEAVDGDAHAVGAVRVENFTAQQAGEVRRSGQAGGDG